MERIASLINKLKEQADQQADPSVLLGIVQLIQLELTRNGTRSNQGLGTAKVAVVLPAAMLPVEEKMAVSANHEKYMPAPAPVAEKMQEKKETILVEEDNVVLVQKNGQLDMLFDPMTEIPTLSHQQTPARQTEVNDNGPAEGESLNDRLKQSKTELMEVLKESPVKDLRKAIGINDRFIFLNELFRGDENAYERSIRTINNFNIYAEAEYWISRELKLKLGWDNNNPAVAHFDQLVKRRFS
jgi:hypothetical protein